QQSTCCSVGPAVRTGSRTCSTSVCYSFSFFFSSRRRHTRCYRDWSSDVCSSDLAQTAGGLGKMTEVPYKGSSAAHPDLIANRIRSEERRVGKECRSRWSQKQ